MEGIALLLLWSRAVGTEAPRLSVRVRRERAETMVVRGPESMTGPVGAPNRELCCWCLRALSRALSCAAALTLFMGFTGLGLSISGAVCSTGVGGMGVSESTRATDR